MNPFEMVVLIVAIVMIARIFATRSRSHRGADGDAAAAAENARLQNEIQQLKERITTLERIAVDKRHRLADEIDALGRD